MMTDIIDLLINKSTDITVNKMLDIAIRYYSIEQKIIISIFLRDLFETDLY